MEIKSLTAFIVLFASIFAFCTGADATSFSVKDAAAAMDRAENTSKIADQAIKLEAYVAGQQNPSPDALAQLAL